MARSSARAAAPGKGHNFTQAQENKAITAALNALAENSRKRTAYSAKLKKDDDKQIGILQGFGMKRGHIREAVQNHILRNSDKDGAAEKAQADLFERLDTLRRCHEAATGEALDFDQIEKFAAMQRAKASSIEAHEEEHGDEDGDDGEDGE